MAVAQELPERSSSTSNTSTLRENLAPILIAIAVFSALSIAAAIASEGFLEADACTHYLYARFAFQQHDLFINVWGRPICTALYSVPAVIGGRLGVRFMSLLLAIGTGLVAFRIARNQGYRWPALALIFTIAQPLMFLHSFSELTELPFAFLLALAFWAYQKRQMLLVAILIGIAPLSRPEGFGFIAMAVVALIAHRRARWLPVLMVPLILWSYVGWIEYGRAGQWWRWLPNHWPYAAESLYDRGSILHFILRWPIVTSPFLFPMMLLGIWLAWQSVCRIWKTRAIEPTALNQAMIAIIPLLILVGHSLLYFLGKMASNGELRYMLVVAPFWGLLSAAGWEWCFTTFKIPRPFIWAGIAAALPILANVYWKVIPLEPDDDWQRARRAVVWFESSGIRANFPNLGAAHPEIFYLLDKPNNDPELDWRKDVLAKPKAGTVLIFDPIYALYNSDANRSVPLTELHADGWIDVTDRVAALGTGWHVLVSPTDAHGGDARDALRSLSPP